VGKEDLKQTKKKKKAEKRGADGSRAAAGDGLRPPSMTLRRGNEVGGLGQLGFGCPRCRPRVAALGKFVESYKFSLVNNLQV
jgi:hypothetical protein